MAMRCAHEILTLEPIQILTYVHEECSHWWDGWWHIFCNYTPSGEFLSLFILFYIRISLKLYGGALQDVVKTRVMTSSSSIGMWATACKVGEHCDYTFY